MADFSRALDLLPGSEAARRYSLLVAREQVYHLQGNREGQMRDLEALGELATTAGSLALAWLLFDVPIRGSLGWLALLTSADNLPEAWGLPQVAGILLEGPAGCGKSELVAAAAARAGAAVNEIPLDLVFKPERLLERVDAGARRGRREDSGRDREEDSEPRRVH